LSSRDPPKLRARSGRPAAAVRPVGRCTGPPVGLPVP